MHGIVKAVEGETGVITGDDGKRYIFRKGLWHGSKELERGMEVTFESEGNEAKEIYGLHEKPEGPGPVAKSKSKENAGILAVLFGTLGAHKFYIGCPLAGILMLMISVSGIFFYAVPTILMACMGIIEGFIYLMKTNDGFALIYEHDKRCWF
ncbi:MAG: TM2 domain-containing protein [Campylobacterota bacterium]